MADNSRQIGVTLPESVLTALDEFAERFGYKRSQAARVLIERMLRQQPQDKQ